MAEFAKIVREVVAELRPKWKLTDVVKGSGPILFYRIPPNAKRLQQQVFFQKGLHGAMWIRANIGTAFIAAGKREAEIDQKVLPDVRYETDDELRTGVTRLVPASDRVAAKTAKRYAKDVKKLARMLDRPATHFEKWFRAEGMKLPYESFDDDDFAEPAFDRFALWLKRKKLMVPAGKLALWHWWCDFRPKKKPKKPKR